MPERMQKQYRKENRLRTDLMQAGQQIQSGSNPKDKRAQDQIDRENVHDTLERGAPHP